MYWVRIPGRLLNQSIMKHTYEGWEGITPELEQLASATFMSITSYSPRRELGGIDREWIELKIAQAIRDYHLKHLHV